MPRLDTQSKDILKNRPQINFVEPELDTTPDIRAVSEQQLEDLDSRREKIRNLADAVTKLIDVMQARVDQKAKDFVVDLDPRVDAAAVQALRRQYPDADDTQITYDQYRKAKQALYDRGDKVGNRMLISPEDLANSNPKNIGGWGLTKGENDRRERERERERIGAPTGTAAAGEGPLSATGEPAGSKYSPSDTDGTFEGDRSNKATVETGGLRPEMDTKNEVVEPLDIDEFQNILIKILVNFIWSNFIRGVFPGFIKKRLPRRLCKLPPGYDDMFSLPGILVLGEDSEKQRPPRIPRNLKDLLK